MSILRHSPAGLIPIPCTEENLLDPYYRYKRDKIISSIENRNHRKSLLVWKNAGIISQQLHTDAKSILKFMKRELSCNGTIIIEGDNEFIALTKQDANLEDVLESYINLFVICKNCGLPELGDDRVCKACGAIN